MDDMPNPNTTRTGMRFVPGGTFLMGSDQHYRDERPAHKVAVSGFWIDETAVTNARVRRLRRGDRLRHRRRAAARSRRLSRGRTRKCSRLDRWCFA